MKPSDADNPLLTHYILDELPANERADIERCLHDQPVLADEVRDLQEMADALRAGAPLHELRLTAPQRARVLQGPPRRPAPAPKVLRSSSPSPLAGWLRLAATITLLAGAFFLGRHQGAMLPTLASSENHQPTDRNDLVVDEPQAAAVEALTSPQEESGLAMKGEGESPTVARVQEESTTEQSRTTTPAVEPEAAVKVAVTQEAVPLVETRVGSLTKEGKEVAAEQPAWAGVTMTAASGESVSAHRRATDQTLLQPGLLRPQVERGSAQLSAKPLAEGERKAAQEAPARRKPALHIHSWSHETASCPWNAQRRLLKVTIQLPADQEAVALGHHDYPVEVVFDANHVREYRRLGARYQPPQEVRRAGTQTLWYEYLPNGKPAETFENGKLIATVRLPGAKFTTQAVGPFDASRLQVLDRGRSWQQARGDFVFDTAVVALALLLDGAGKDNALNQPLVLELAEAARAAGDPDGSRSRFIEAVREVGRLAGR